MRISLIIGVLVAVLLGLMGSVYVAVSYTHLDVYKRQLQDPFLNALRRERIPVSVYLVNGIKLQGTIESFDQFVVLLRNTVSQMVYKHAISTVVPARNVRAVSYTHLDVYKRQT